MEASRIYTILEKHLPPTAIAYGFQLWQGQPFDFRLRKKRISKVGDFSFRPGKVPRITINQDSHPFLFLITYVHEVAHLMVHQRHGWKTESHGCEWKEMFRQLMAPLMTEDIFPLELLVLLKKHMVDPKASSFSDTKLTHMLRQFDERQKSTTLLSEIPQGSVFGLHGRWFKKGPLKRTRVLCRELKTKRNYLVPADSPVENTQLSLLPGS